MRNRTYISLFHTDNEGLTKEIKMSLDKIDSIDINLNLVVCSFDSIRGRNKTDHAYKEQTEISISGAFSERTADKLSSEFFKYGKDKLKNIQDLFLSFLNDKRLFIINTRYKSYYNYVLKSCSFSWIGSGSIKADFSFIEVLIRNNEELFSDHFYEDFSPKITYAPPLADALIDPKASFPTESKYKGSSSKMGESTYMGVEIGNKLDIIKKEEFKEKEIDGGDKFLVLEHNKDYVEGDPNLITSYNNTVKTITKSFSGVKEFSALSINGGIIG